MAEEDACAICNNIWSTKKNQIIYCDGPDCNVPVHQECYGVPVIPDGNWYCQMCQNKKRHLPVRTICCPSRSGAFKNTTERFEFMHVVCAKWCKEIDHSLEPYLVKKHLLGAKECQVCWQKSGLCVQCTHSSCSRVFHVTCGLDKGWLDSRQVDRGEPIQCTEHTHSGFQNVTSTTMKRKQMATDSFEAQVRDLFGDDSSDEDDKKPPPSTLPGKPQQGSRISPAPLKKQKKMLQLSQKKEETTLSAPSFVHPSKPPELKKFQRLIQRSEQTGPKRPPTPAPTSSFKLSKTSMASTIAPVNAPMTPGTPTVPRTPMTPGLSTPVRKQVLGPLSLSTPAQTPVSASAPPSTPTPVLVSTPKKSAPLSVQMPTPAPAPTTKVPTTPSVEKLPKENGLNDELDVKNNYVDIVKTKLTKIVDTYFPATLTSPSQELHDKLETSLKENQRLQHELGRLQSFQKRVTEVFVALNIPIPNQRRPEDDIENYVDALRGILRRTGPLNQQEAATISSNVDKLLCPRTR